MREGGTKCECDRLSIPPGAWAGDPREPEVSEAHLLPPLDKSGLIWSWKLSRVGPR